MENKSEFKIGDKVWYVGRGWGEVTETGVLCESYPIKVVFGEGALHFTQEGKYCLVDKFPSLFFQEIEISKEALERPRWRAEKGGAFFSVDMFGRIEMSTDYHNEWCDKLFDVGNYFQTTQEAVKSKHYKVFHE